MEDNDAHREASWNLYLAGNQQEWKQVDPLVRFGRAFADPMRVRILSLLAEKSMYGQELAEALHVTPPTVSRHVAFLKLAGLVQLQRERVHYYHLDNEGPRHVASWLSVEKLRQLAASLPKEQVANTPQSPTEKEQHDIILAIFFNDGRLSSLPEAPALKRVLVGEIAKTFEQGKLYTEADVNTSLKQFYEDTESLLRALIDEKFMAQDRGYYWLMQAPQTSEQEQKEGQ